MSTALGPPVAAPTTLRGALSTFPSFIRRNVPAIVASAVAAGILGWVVNVWMLAVKFEGNNDVPTGSPVTGQNNTNWASIFWVLFSMVLFGAVGYARAVGMRRFLGDLRTAPRTLFGLVRSEGAVGRVHLLWGAALALLLGLVIPPAVGAIVSVGILATLTTIIGAIAGSVLGRVFSGLLKPFRSNSQPLGIDAMIVGLVGSGLALAVGFVVPNSGVRAAAAAVCVLLAIVLSQQMKPAASAAVVVIALAAYQALRWILHAKQVLADDGGFAECGLDFGTWWRQCEGAGAVRRQAIPGGVAAALGSPVGLFLGSWAGSMARLVPHVIHPHPTPPGRQPVGHDDNPIDLWRDRSHAWSPDAPVSVEFPGGQALTGVIDTHGHHCTPWLPTGERPSPFVDPIATPHSFAWRADSATGIGTGIADRFNALHHHAPGPEFLHEVKRFYDAAPHQVAEHNLTQLARLEHEHRLVWTDRLASAQHALGTDVAHGLSASDIATTEATTSRPMGGVIGLMREQSDRFVDVVQVPPSNSTSAHHLFHNVPPDSAHMAATVQQLETTLVDMQHMAAQGHGLPGFGTATSLGHHQSVPHGGPVAMAVTGMAGQPGVAHTGHSGMALGLERRHLPLDTGSQLVDAPGGRAVVTPTSPGAVRELASNADHARTVVNAPDHVDRLLATRNLEPASDLTRQFDAIAARTQQLAAMQHQAHELTASYDELARLGTQIASDPTALRNLAINTPWRADDLVEAVQHGGSSSMPLTRAGLPNDAELAWFRNHHRDLALAGTDHSAIARNLAPAGAPDLVGQLEQIQHTMHQMHDMRAMASACDQLNDMQHMLGDVVNGRADAATTNSISQQHYSTQLAQLTDQAQRALAAEVARQAQQI